MASAPATDAPPGMLPSTDWIFFDCYNTLLDDFLPSGQDAGLCSVPRHAVELGFFPDPHEFEVAYRHVRMETIRLGSEITLDLRLRRALEAGPAKRSRAECEAGAAKLIEAWKPEYRQALRPAPGVEEMLQHWASRRRLGVVTNALLPGMPAEHLRHFGLGRYFSFILDSATHGFKKPNPLLMMEALSLAGLGPCDGDRVLAVGSRADVDLGPAKDLNMHVVLFDRSAERPTAHPGPADTPAIRAWSEFR